MTIEEMNALSEEELEEAKHNWTPDDWIAYYTKDGVMTLDELYDYMVESLAYYPISNGRIETKARQMRNPASQRN